jgi:hypothetical protein
MALHADEHLDQKDRVALTDGLQVGTAVRSR